MTKEQELAFQEYLDSQNSPELARMEADYISEYSPEAYDEMLRDDNR